MSKPRAGSAPAARGDGRAPKRSVSPSLFRRIAAATTALVLGAGLALVAVAAPASAHKADVTGEALCAADGTYTITWKVTTSDVEKKRVGEVEITEPADVASVKLPDVKGGGSFTWVQKGVPGDHTTAKVAFRISWDNNYVNTPGATITLAGDCGDASTVKRIEFCHATGSAKHPYERIETSVSAFFEAGHIDHQNHGDIYPAFSYSKHGELIEVPAQGDQSLLEYEDCALPAIAIEIPAKPEFVDTCGTANDRIIPPAASTGVDWTISPISDRTATATATALDGYVFSGGETTRSWTFKFSDDPCEIPAVAEPTAVDQCGVEGDRLELPNVEHVTWQVDGEPTQGGTVTVTAVAADGYAFPKGVQTTWELSFTDKPCAPTVIPLVAVPSFVDVCGSTGDGIELPAAAEHISWVVTGDPKVGGAVTVTAVADEGYAFGDEVDAVFEFTFDTTPCPIELPVPAEPETEDACGVDDDRIVQPSALDGVAWTISPVVDGTATATASAKPGFTFPNGTTSETWSFTFDDEPCIEPSLEGSVATGLCIADAPWIFYQVELTDPDHMSTGNTASLVLSDGTNTHTSVLGDLVDGKLEGKVLWPGASVAADGVTPTGWPGWELVGTTWVQVDGNFAWTRAITEATIEVNPEVTVAVSYPAATPECAAGPEGSGDGGSTSAAPGTGLASTGFAGTTFAIVAGVIVAAGIAFLVIARVRRKRP